MAKLELHVENFIRVTQTTGVDIEGRYDGENYIFRHNVPNDVHMDVARHVFGFGLAERSDDPKIQDKMPALLRLGWVASSGDTKAGLDTLRTQVRFEEVPPFPHLLRLRKPEENSGLPQMELPESTESPDARVPSPIGGGKTGAVTAAAPDQPSRKIKDGNH